MKKKSTIIGIGFLIVVFISLWLVNRPKTLGNMNQSYTEPVTNSSDISFLGEAGDKIKFSFASDIESGELDIVLYDSEENVVYELDRAKELETFYVLNNSDTYTYTLAAEYSDFVGKFKIKVYKVD